MPSLLVRGIAGLALAVLLFLLALPQLALASSLRQSATTPVEEMAPVAATYRGSTGWGPWRTEVIEVRATTGAGELELVRVAPLPDGVEPDRHPVVLLTADGAAHRFAEVAPAPTAWLPFAATGGTLLVLAVAAVALAARPFGVAVFGQRDPAARAVGWLPGHGSHGGPGGQVPPYVPYAEEWDPKRRIR